MSENKTSNITSNGLSAYVQLDNALGSPSNKIKNWLKNICKY